MESPAWNRAWKLENHGDGGGGGGGYPLYSSADCPFLDVGFRCAENGRPDASYTKWRWQPSRCHLPRLVACSLASIRFVSPLLASTLLAAHYLEDELKHPNSDSISTDNSIQIQYEMEFGKE